MIDLISGLYLLNAAIVIVAYVPQIIKLKAIKEKPKNFSLPSWTLWTYTSIVAFLYAVFVIQDTILIFVNALALLSVSLVFIIVLYKHRKYC